MSDFVFFRSYILNIFRILKPEIDRPIFILSAPRSGSSYFYETMMSNPDIWGLKKENDPLWFYFFPYKRSKSMTDWIGADECNTEIIEKFKLKLLKKILQQQGLHAYKVLVPHFFMRQPMRYIEKTIANCFHLEALNEIFPDALYIHLVRDGRACISSMLEGWNSNFFWKRPIPLTPQSTIKHWCYPIPPNWQKMTSRPLVEICAWSWVEHNRYILDYLYSNRIEKNNYLRISYEELLSNPISSLKKVESFTDLNISNKCLNHLEKNITSWTTISAPSKNKWKKNSDLIDSVNPLIEDMMKKLGYQC